ncbi:MAG: alpha/beta hydrolase [Acidimicrobiia bacterium]|nr:alpha/beta hydrolase [Acidimicrobiia bacterium]
MPDLSATDGVGIHYEVWGRRDRSPVLMIQGLGADSRSWALQRVPFGRRHRCVAPDNRGTGRSEKPPGPYDLEQMAADAVAALDAEGIDRAHVMGASMGGVIAQIVAVRYPERVRSLTLACTACRHHEWRRELLAEWADEVTAHGMQSMASDGLRWLVGPRLQRRFGMWINVLARLILSMPPEPFVAQIRAILDMTDDVRFELHTIEVPTLIITGSQDALTPVGDAEEIAEMIPGSRLSIVSGAAHGVMAEAPNAYNATVLDFIDEVDAAQVPDTAAV